MLNPKGQRRRFNEVYIEPSKEFRKIYLTDDTLSWVDVGHISTNEGGLTNEEFEELWKEKPAKKATIKIFGKTVECPRYTKNYLNPYTFSGIEHEALEKMPKVIERLYIYSKGISPNLNQCLVNFYEANGSIGKHSDNEKQIVRGSDIHSWTFGPASRYFVLESLNGSERFKINVTHNTLLIMGGKCQEEFCHQVPKKLNIDSEDVNERRINVTFREFR